MPFKKAYPDARQIDISDMEKPDPELGLSGLDDNGNIYFSLQYDSSMAVSESARSAIYRYSTSKKEWETIIDTGNSSNSSFQCANDKYMLWYEDQNANWMKVSLHVYDLTTKTDTEIYTYTETPKPI